MSISMAELENREFRYIISLGYFCSVAQELKRLGLRDASYPFDWVIADFSGVMEAIENGFQSWLAYDCLSQWQDYPQYYRNSLYNVDFYHDFSKYKSLKKQIKSVEEKYQRRIARFYNSIRFPTLFIRYISDEVRNQDGKSVELQWIEDNYDRIVDLLRSYNENNSIIFIGNEGMQSEKIYIFNVAVDDNGCAAKRPVDKSEELSGFLTALNYPGKQENLQKYDEKQMARLFKRIVGKAEYFVRKTFCRVYVHEKRC